MKVYVIADRSEEQTKYYAGLNGWVKLPNNAIQTEHRAVAEQDMQGLNLPSLFIEEYEIED